MGKICCCKINLTPHLQLSEKYNNATNSTAKVTSLQIPRAYALPSLTLLYDLCCVYICMCVLHMCTCIVPRSCTFCTGRFFCCSLQAMPGTIPGMAAAYLTGHAHARILSLWVSKKALIVCIYTNINLN